jgi:hypothetical protein
MPFVEYPGPDEPFPPILLKPGPHIEVTARYDHVDVDQVPGVALFRVVHPAPIPKSTPAQLRAQREEAEHYYYSLSVHRHLAHIVCNELGYPAACTRRACRRARACIDDRHEFDWSFPGPWMPPCAGTIRRIDRVRERVLPMLAALNAELAAREEQAAAG